MGALTYLIWGAAMVALIWQNFARDLVFVTIGYGREMQPLDDFPYECSRVKVSGEDEKAQFPLLQACEDMWLSESTRQLFLACSDSRARGDWMPAVQHYNASGRSKSDRFVVLDLDSNSPESDDYSFPASMLEMPGFTGGELHMAGFAASEDANGDNIQLVTVNTKPHVDPVTGDPMLERSASGDINSTIEHFRVVVKADDGDDKKQQSLEHVATYSHPAISSPNRVALAPGGEGFFFTNDHGTSKNVWLQTLSPLLKTGDVTYCSFPSTPTGPIECYPVSTGHSFPNGLVSVPGGGDGDDDDGQDLLYVPSAIKGTLSIYNISFSLSSSSEPLPKKALTEHITTLPLGIPMDNIALDRKTGDLYAAGIPDMLTTAEHMGGNTAHAIGRTMPGTVLRISKRTKDSSMSEGEEKQEEYEVTKVIEDGKAEVFPGLTTVVHDSTSGRLFLSGVVSPYIVMCKPKAE